MTPATLVALGKAEPLLVKRLGELQERLQAGDKAAWTEFLQVMHTLVALTQAVKPENGGPMLTTAEMASRLGVAPKTLLKRKRRGEIRPAVERGKLLRWSGQERLG